MRTCLLALALSLTAAAGCSKSESGAPLQAEPTIPNVSIDELDQLLAKSAAIPVDANGDRTRQKLGVIPGAVLLSDSETFLPSELPTDKAKPLVFYCANTSCGASHEAAAKALTAGYRDVRVLPEGIAGWTKAGKKTASI